MQPRRIVILGSTGSIGRQTIDICKRHAERFRIVGLSAARRIDDLLAQVGEVGPEVVAVPAEAAHRLEKTGVTVLSGRNALGKLASWEGADVVVNALVGSVGVEPTLAAIESGKTLALANKESLVVGGPLVVMALERGGEILPIDSEHSAIFQCLVGEDRSDVERIIITGSGGPFRGRKLRELENVSVEEALAHPRWKMGPKITIDSATLMNKGLEVIEAHWLFGFSYDAIELLIHPQSIIHSLVEFRDGSVKAQLGPTDMRLPIQYALSYPERLEPPLPSLDFARLAQFTFEAPDQENFPCLRLALQAARAGESFPAVLNAANEEAVYAYLDKKLTFGGIARVIEAALELHEGVRLTGLGILREVDEWARRKAHELIDRESR